MVTKASIWLTTVTVTGNYKKYDGTDNQILQKNEYLSRVKWELSL